MTIDRTESQSTEVDEPASGTDGAPEPYALFVLASTDRSAVGRRVDLPRDTPVLVGRKVERGGFSIEDPRLSRVHARIAWDARCRAFRIADLDSANGVWVGDERHRVAELRPGSPVRLGGTLLAVAPCQVMERLEERTRLAARSSFNVLIRGETGTGKEHLAAALHAESEREGAFVPVNCSAFSRELLAAELFGHTRSAFSGATGERPGLFRAAHRGTLFLDEIGDMAPELQPVLLRALQERAIRPVGGDREVPVDVRIVSATHQDLEALLLQGRFRADLKARLAQVELEVPPLRERLHTLPEIIATISRRLQIDVEVSVGAMAAMASYDWNDNVRGVENLLTRLRLFGKPPLRLDRAFLQSEAPDLLRSKNSPGSTIPPAAAAVSSSSVPPAPARDELVQALKRHGGRVSDVAQELSTSRTQVYRWLKRWGIALPSARDGGDHGGSDQNEPRIP